MVGWISAAICLSSEIKQKSPKSGRSEFSEAQAKRMQPAGPGKGLGGFCLVQPAGCNPAKKKAVQTQGQGRQVPNEKRFKIAKKNLQDSVVRLLDFRGHLTPVPPQTAPTARERSLAAGDFTLRIASVILGKPARVRGRLT